MRETSEELRESIDGSDPFVLGGHQILKVRQGRKRSVPVWAKTDASLKALIYKVFPKMFSDAKQRKRAARWAYIAYHYHRGGDTAQAIANELGIKRGHVQMILVGMRRVASGMRYDGSGQKGVRSVGRPRKFKYPIQFKYPTQQIMGRSNLSNSEAK